MHSLLFTALILFAGAGVLSERSLPAGKPIVAVAAGQGTQQEDQSLLNKGKKKKSTEKKVRPAKVTSTREIIRANFTKRSDSEDVVEVIISSSGKAYRNIRDLQMIGSSGSTIVNGNYMAFEQIKYPFEGTVRFSAPNPTGYMYHDREIKFEVNERGHWLLRIEL